MRIRLIFRSTAAPVRQSDDTLGIFTTLAPPPRPWLPIFGSLAAHGVLVALTTLVGDRLARGYAEDFDWSAYRVEMMKLRVPEPLYYAPAVASNASSNGQAGSSSRIQDAPAASRAFRATAAELPYIKASEKQTAPILQPSRAESTPAKLPPLTFWARTGEQAPTPKRDEIKLPGAAEQPAPPPRLASTPVLAIPNREPNLADVNVSASAAIAAALLPLLPSATAPVRNRRADAQNGALDSSPGQSTNVISLSAEPVRPGDVIDVPAGSSGPSAAGAGQSAGGSSRSGAEMSQEAGGASDPRAPKVGQTSTNVVMGRNPAAATTAGGAEAFTRIMHPPNGNFDVVVTQSGGQAELPGFATQLSGNPIYTVYLPVGDVTEWVLTFCLPVRKDSGNSRYEVYIEDASPLSPPYPVTTTIPQSIIGETRRRLLAFRGLLSAAGTFRDITASEASPATEKIAAALSDWKFRPAKKNNTPTEVEILLMVVPSSN